MGVRRESRELVIQTFYGLEYAERDEYLGSISLMDSYKEILDSIASEKKVGISSNIYTYADKTLRDMLPIISEIDEIIDKNIEGFKLDRIGVIETIILRLSIYEMLYVKTPAAVMINEALELSKIFCAERSHLMINAILDRVGIKN